MPTQTDLTRPNPNQPEPTRTNPTQPDPTRPNPNQPEPTRPNPNLHRRLSRVARRGTAGKSERSGTNLTAI